MRPEEHDALAATVDAYRRATAKLADGGATRARVLVAAGARAGRRALLRRALLGLSVGFVAALSGHAAWTALAPWRAARLPPPRVSPATPARVALRADVPGPLEAPSSPTGAFAPPSSAAGASALRSWAAGASALKSSAAGASAPKPEGGISAASHDEATEASAYGRAHAAHFASDDPARALGLWDAYLRGFPAGVFVPEARFNRALCLLRLGRREAAVVALRPFANGAFGDYRVREARSLIDWTALPAGTNDAGAAR
jgi:hypothetical protein